MEDTNDAQTLTAGHEFEGKVVVVTGGASGIGLAVCKLFAARGCKVLMTDIDVELGEKSISDIQANVERPKDDFVFLKVDVTKEEDVEEMVRSAVERFGRIDLSVNCAGVEPGLKTIDESSTDYFLKVMQINCFGVYYSMKHEIKAMKAQGKPESGTYAIVNIGSTASVMGLPAMSDYVASKHAVLGLTRTAAKEVAPLGIRINAMCPGPVKTPLSDRFVTSAGTSYEEVASGIPLGRVASSSEIAQGVLFLCSSQCGFIVGHALTACGGLSDY